MPGPRATAAPASGALPLGALLAGALLAGALLAGALLVGATLPTHALAAPATDGTRAAATQPGPPSVAPATAPAAIPDSSPSGTVPACVLRLGPGARPLGHGTLRWFGLRVYRAELWSGSRGLDPGTLDAQPFALRLQYLRSLRGSDIARRSDELMHDMHAGLDPQARAEWLSAMLRMFPDVHDGDTLCGVYLPHADSAARTEFLAGDRLLGSIPGAAFARAFFGIWLSPHSPQPGLRAELLAGAAR